jgi:hypothetical protein
VKKVVSLLIAALTFGVMPSAQADPAIFNSYSAEDRRQPADMNYRYEPMSISVEIRESNKSELIIKAYFSSSLNAESFLNYGGNQPLLRIKIMNNLEAYKNDAGYIWLEAPNNIAYQGSTPINPVSSIYADPKKGPSGGRIPLTACKTKTWMAPGNSGNWVAFSIDRVCSDIADLSWVVAFMDSSIYAPTYFLDSKFFPSEPLFINTQSVPRPAKMKDQSVAFAGSVGTQNLDNPKVTSSVTSSLSLPVTVNSLTPTICLPSLSGFTITTALLKAGTCTLEAFAAGNSATNPSPRVTTSFTVNPKVMIKQDLTWDEPFAVMEGDAPFDLYLSSSAGLPVKVTSDSPSVCQFYDSTKPSFVTILSAGTCSISVRVDATDKYFEASGSASFDVDPKPVVKKPPTTSTKTSPNPKTTPSAAPKPPKKKTKTIFGGTGSTTTNETFDTKQGTADTRGVGTKKTTITCKKGGLEKKVTAVKPVCEKGWVKK